jgi:hypothetical protein
MRLSQNPILTKENAVFGDRVLAFYDSLERFRWATPEVALLSPVADEQRRLALAEFCAKFYNDEADRVFWMGINPSRVRRTSTGVPYTDGFALEECCGIANAFEKRRELTADFFYQFVERYGGAEAFYARHFAGAAYPLSILKKDKYSNYYDRDLPEEIKAAVADMLLRQSRIGSRGVLVVIGSGENAKFLRRLNEELRIFAHVLVVEHPRYILQYKSANLEDYLVKFCDVAHEAERLAGLAN